MTQSGMKAPADLTREELVELAKALRDLFYLDPESNTFSYCLDTSDADLVACVRWQLEMGSHNHRNRNVR